MLKQTPQKRRWIRWLQWTAGVVAGLVILTVVGTSVYVHTASVPALLALPNVADSTGGASSAAASVDGVWNAASGSIVGFRTPQVLIGQQLPIVERTGKVWGSLTIAGGSVSQGSFSVDMSALTGSLSKTTRKTVFDVSAYPTATLALTGPIPLDAIPADGTVERLAASASITMHGVSHVVRFTAAAERAGSSIYVLADITFPYGDWNLSAQGVPFLADLESPATIEVLLRLTQGEGNSVSAASSAPGLSTAGGAL